MTLASSEPLLGTTEPFGGETTLVTLTGGLDPIDGQVTVEVTSSRSRDPVPCAQLLVVAGSFRKVACERTV